MPDLIQKKCPSCGAILTIRNQQGIQNMTVNCPVCHQSYPFSGMADVNLDPMRNGGGDGERTHIRTNSSNRAIGKLRLLPSGMVFNLRSGRNIIGRQSPSSSATIQINTGGNLRMSRQHLLIEVATDQMGNIVHYCSLCKAQTNDTYINGALLQFGDRAILRSGMQIKLPDATLNFEIESNDPDKTIY